jgi:Mn2+/Fe2+ NRAMP family transporter
MPTKTIARNTDPYIRTEESIQEPPVTFWGIASHLGPGFVLSAAIVGSGELIAPTALGARAGFIAFWVIIVSCLVKVTLQLEFGKHVIHSGESSMYSLNQLPGPRIGKAKWPIWVWLFIQIFKLLQVGGIVGGVAITLHITFPAIPVPVWTGIVTTVTSLLVYRGYYQVVEKFSLLMIALFSVFTLASLFFLQYTPYAFTWNDVQQGLRFELPPAIVGIAIAAFGITGVGGDEILYYNYWCLEKGYAAFTGPREDTEHWVRRAKGWIKVMYIDAIVAMVVYTSVTAAFYLLGAAILHKTGEVPEGYQMIEALSTIYTQSLGPWAKSVFMAGALIVLYSTLFTATASWTRIFSDAFGQIGWMDFYNPQVRKRAVAWLAWLFPISWALLFLFIKLPVLMVLLGGFVTSILLLLVVYAAIHFRYRRLPASLYPGKIYDVSFWVSVVAILLAGVYGITQLLQLL